MKVTSFKTYRYCLPLKYPVVIRGISQTRLREGIIISLTLDSQWQGFAEIAPLKGSADIKIEAYLDNFKKLAYELTSLEPTDNPDGLFQWIDSFPLVPEVCFGVETALYGALARKLRKPLSYFWGESPSSAVMVNGLLQEEELLEQAVNDLLRKGFKSIKVKAGPAVEKDIARVRAALKLLNNRARVHLDVNQRWSYDDALYFAGAIGPKQVEYIEEPFKDIGKIPDFFHRTGIACAIDESLISGAGRVFKPGDGVKVWVLKPTLLGGISKALAVANEAKKNGMEIVISSSFESGIGLFSLIQLAAGLGGACRAGIDTLKYFEKDLLKAPFMIQEGKIAASPGPLTEGDINLENLIQV